MSKAEERAFERCPQSENVIEEMRNARRRASFIEGYHQAEKDLELTWEDIKTIDKLLNQCVDYSNPYQEVLKRFKEERNRV